MNEPLLQFSVHSSDCRCQLPVSSSHYFSAFVLFSGDNLGSRSTLKRKRVHALLRLETTWQKLLIPLYEVVVNKLFSVHTWQFMRLLISPTRFSLSCVELGEDTCSLGGFYQTFTSPSVHPKYELGVVMRLWILSLYVKIAPTISFVVSEVTKIIYFFN